MTDEEQKKTIATFRFGVIADFVTGVKLTYGDKEMLLRQKVNRSYEIPFSKRTRIGRATILQWVSDYKNAGFRIEGLFPKTRRDKGVLRKLDPSVRLAIKETKKEHPSLTVPALITLLKHKKVIAMNEHINMTSVYRFIKHEKLHEVNADAVDKRAFEASYANEIWQSDVMHGPFLTSKINDRVCKGKAYLHAIIDDHSRLIVHAQFYLSETLDAIKDCLRQAVAKRGLPQKFYVDNGACFSAVNLEQVCASLGIALVHSRPYIPQGRGKIERWFRNVRDNFLSVHKDIKSIDELNDKFFDWTEEYNSSIHSTTKQTPYDRYKKNLEMVRPAPAELLDYFRLIEFRKVKKDRSVQLNGKIFEVALNLIDRRVELKYHKDEPDRVEVFFENRSFGFATPTCVHVNARIGRSWNKEKEEPNARAPTKPTSNSTTVHKSGELFNKTQEQGHE
jgi:putative transposase